MEIVEAHLFRVGHVELAHLPLHDRAEHRHLRSDDVLVPLIHVGIAEKVEQIRATHGLQPPDAPGGLHVAHGVERGRDDDHGARAVSEYVVKVDPGAAAFDGGDDDALLAGLEVCHRFQ